MGPRANFECRRCQATYEDLPVQAVRCPVCGLKRGFRRLFDSVNVASGVTRGTAGGPPVDSTVRAAVDRLVRPALEQRDMLRASRQQQEASTRDMRDRMAAANLPVAPELPAGSVGAPSMPQGPGQLLRAISPAGAEASRALNLQVLSGLRQHGQPQPIIVGRDPTPLPR